VAARGDVLPAPSITRKRVDRYVTQPLGAVPNAGPVELTDWERETVALAARGLSDDESADRMVIARGPRERASTGRRPSPAPVIAPNSSTAPTSRDWAHRSAERGAVRAGCTEAGQRRSAEGCRAT
jgi:hypothetical protein